MHRRIHKSLSSTVFHRFHQIIVSLPRTNFLVPVKIISNQKCLNRFHFFRTLHFLGSITRAARIVAHHLPQLPKRPNPAVLHQHRHRRVTQNFLQTITILHDRHARLVILDPPYPHLPRFRHRKRTKLLARHHNAPQNLEIHALHQSRQHSAEKHGRRNFSVFPGVGTGFDLGAVRVVSFCDEVDLGAVRVEKNDGKVGNGSGI
ncbi:hypothetical protein V8G54_018799 [Vigna mungo]|uniref:Uncharacterized protein n=1 Tax=Vigna mungo TaxID=3915 RepID=A0AAQ3NAM7_VIGMU